MIQIPIDTVIAVSLDRSTVDAAYQRLREADIYCAVHECALRISPHLYNTIDDMDAVADVLVG